ncbi:uncharacterized protein LOC125568087 [Nematostella vectensis]|uniref:uncharacterized protein LOC125568087 n=1 Tax=Nematostella vectensis TaxID=45351 RepID=UPI002076F96F|nr:uncharacterized protein LOC125568087 [Nematostella vectensis]
MAASGCNHDTREDMALTIVLILASILLQITPIVLETQDEVFSSRHVFLQRLKPQPGSPEELYVFGITFRQNGGLLGYPRPGKKRFLSARLGYYSNSEARFQLSRLSTSGDINPNPGPSLHQRQDRKAGSKDRRVCSECDRVVAKNHRATYCDSCSCWTHIKCGGVLPKLYVQLQASGNVSHTCGSCLEILQQIPFADASLNSNNSDYSKMQSPNSFFNDSLNNSIDNSVCNSTVDSSMEQPKDWFIQNIKSYYKSNLIMAYLNINSIFRKADELLELLDSCQLDLLFIAETKIDSTVPNSLFKHPDYRVIRKDKKKGAGGILVFIRSNVKAYRRVKLEPDGVECICLDVKGSGNAWFLAFGGYRSESVCSPSDFISACGNVAENMYAKRKEVMFVGDFNMDMNTDTNSRGPHPALTGFCDQFCLTNTIVHPTSVTSSTKSLLDVVLVSHPDRCAKSGNLHLGISDRDLVYAVRKQKLPKPTARIVEYRSMKALDKDAFVSDLRDIPWDSAYAFDDVDDVWSHWAALFCQVVDKHVCASTSCLGLVQRSRERSGCVTDYTRNSDGRPRTTSLTIIV